MALAELHDYNEAWKLAKGKCPTCQGTGKYRLYDVEYECPKDEYGRDVHMTKFRNYCLANIPAEFHPLDIADFPFTDIRDEMVEYIEKFPAMRRMGLGWEFYGKSRGVGKSWAAASILKGLVNAGHNCWFAVFSEIKTLHEMDDPKRREFLRRKITECEVLVLDEILEPHASNAQRAFYEEKLEDIIRLRSMNNFPTIITTNLDPESMDKYYGRIYSILSSKQFRKELEGDDHRKQDFNRRREIALNDEAEPIL